MTAEAVSEVVHTHLGVFVFFKNAFPLTLFERSEDGLKNTSNHHFLAETTAVTVSVASASSMGCEQL